MTSQPLLWSLAWRFTFSFPYFLITTPLFALEYTGYCHSDLAPKNQMFIGLLCRPRRKRRMYKFGRYGEDLTASVWLFSWSSCDRCRSWVRR